jgi:hypothetical protein
MRNKGVFAALTLFLLAIVPSLHAAACSNAAAAGKWGFTTNGTMFRPQFVVGDTMPADCRAETEAVPPNYNVGRTR